MLAELTILVLYTYGWTPYAFNAPIIISDLLFLPVKADFCLPVYSVSILLLLIKIYNPFFCRLPSTAFRHSFCRVLLLHYRIALPRPTTPLPYCSAVTGQFPPLLPQLPPLPASSPWQSCRFWTRSIDRKLRHRPKRYRSA